MPVPPESLIRRSCRTHLELRASLLEAFPDLDDTTLKDTLEGLSDLDLILSALIRSALEDQVLVDALARRIGQMQDRRDRLTTRIGKKRALALKGMIDGAIPVLHQSDFSAFVRKSPPAVEIFASDEIPPAYWKPQPPVLDRAGLARVLKQGASVSGARLVPGNVQLSVRTQ